ncbi:hypothetical protein [Halorarius halobius]|uniref:hypothetical protein n=1 Tax=Halorarius halobius TaxID=2962671 RepID=UPI0020CE372A|nr:hypothetical protein [Halorarius halobius]
MRLTQATVRAERDRVRENDRVVPLVNDVRDALGDAFEADVGHVTREQYAREVDAVFADGDVAVNVAALAGLLRDLDVAGDYPGFVVDELLGRELAATLAGGRPFSLLAEATFHYADIHTHGSDGEAAGRDDLDAALAAGFQTRLPGWDWTETESPFAIEE